MAAPDVAIYHASPATLKAINDGPPLAGELERARKHVAMTTWETSVLPEHYAEALNEYSAVIVPSNFCALAFEAADLSNLVLPHCFDPAFWTLPAPRVPNMPYRFYTIGAAGERKNSMGVLKAYLSAFTAADPVVLVMLVAGGSHDEVRSLVARTGLPASELPKFNFITDTVLSEEDLRDLHAQGDCYVSATRGEGWGLGLFEAAIMGRRIIAPTIGGHRDFLVRNTHAYDVGSCLTPCFGSEVRGEIVERDGRLVQTSRMAMPPGVTCRQQWGEPALAEMANAMRDNSYAREPYAHDERKRLEDFYSYAAIGPRLINQLRGIL